MLLPSFHLWKSCSSTCLRRNIVRPEANHHDTTPDTQHTQDENHFHAELESSRAAPCPCNLTRILLRRSSAAHVFGAASCAGRNELLFFNPFRPSPLDLTRSTVPSMKLHSLSLLQLPHILYSLAALPEESLRQRDRTESRSKDSRCQPRIALCRRAMDGRHRMD